MKKWMIGALLVASIAGIAQNSNLELLGKRSMGMDLNDVWGYEDEHGNEYALIGTVFGFSIVDITHAEDSLPEVFADYDSYTVWRDVKTWNNHAYVTCECNSGLLIVDLNPLPDSHNLNFTYWKSNDSLEFASAHNLYIDENGVAYIFGANKLKGGAIMLDLTQDPMNPVELGVYDDAYLHDGVVRGDTLWGAAVNDGLAQVIDVSDKSNPQLLSSWVTPNAFTHNIWFSDDNDFVFTTDEVQNGRIAAYDVSNILNPKEVDTWMPNDSLIIPHNTHFINDFLVTSHYTIGVNIIDVKRPNNMIETGRYDTSPLFNYEGFHGGWGAYPYFSSGKIIVTDIEEGLYVFDPTYERGCYLEGKVTDEHTGGQIFFPTIEIIEDSIEERGGITGGYAISTIDAGTYTVKFSADGYYSKTISGVELKKGELTTLNVELSNWPTGVGETLVNQKVDLFPNPADTKIYLQSDDEIKAVSVYDSKGALVMSKAFSQAKNDLHINVSALKPGVYMVTIETVNDLVRQNLIVE